MEWIKNVLSSRAFWTGLGPVIVAFFALIGSPLGDDKIQALSSILMAIAGWVTVTATRAARGIATSYRQK